LLGRHPDSESARNQDIRVKADANGKTPGEAVIHADAKIVQNQAQATALV